jgi:two-component system, cell cycle sensor histidine kinase and response regulator CckA
MPTVLVLDDDPTILNLLGTYLRRSAYTAFLSLTSESAMEQFRRSGGAVDLLIADVTLPDKSGVYIGVHLRTEYPGLRLLFISGYPQEDWNEADRVLLGQLPPESVRVLVKPFSPMDLITKVDELLGLPGSDVWALTSGG